MPYRRRLLALLVFTAALGAPAVALRAACVGHSCDEPVTEQVRLPFCSLPPDHTGPIEDGFRDGRSPDVLLVASPPGVRGEIGPGDPLPEAAWPTVERPDLRVPIGFWGRGVRASAEVPAGTDLRRVAPTLERVLAFRRPHPEVRSGEAIEGVAREAAPRLALLVALKGVGTAELESKPDAWPNLRHLFEEGAGTLEGTTGSLPLDPAATLTTVGTGGLPSEHGVTGTYLRNDEGEVVRAWGPGAPLTVIASLGDDLGQVRGGSTLVGIVLDDPADLGLVGGSWYLDAEADDVVRATGPASVPARVEALLAAGYGAEEGRSDLLGVVLHGPLPRIDRALGEVVDRAVTATGGSLVVAVAGTGTSSGTEDAFRAADVVGWLERSVGRPGVIAAAAAGGLYLDKDVTAAEGISTDRIVRAALELADGRQGRLFADAFPAFAVSFARYC